MATPGLTLFSTSKWPKVLPPLTPEQRRISGEFTKVQFGGDYSWFWKRGPINLSHEILAELELYFVIQRKRFVPLPLLPMVFCNLCIGLPLEPGPAPIH